MLFGFYTTFASVACVAADAAEAKRPNIVLVMADDQGWGDVGYNSRGLSEVKTPVLDEMAAASLQFNRFYAAAPVCSPTRGSVMTGRHPNRFGCFSWGRSLRPQEITIAEVFKKSGYTTGHFGKWHLGSVRADSEVCPGNSGFDRWVSAPNFYDNDSMMSDQGKVVQCSGESSMIAMDPALEFMTEAARDGKPFLAVVWFGSPHLPHIGADDLLAEYDDIDGLSKAQRNFLAEITGIDRAVGRLRTALRELGIADNTLVWYTSDNGALPVGSAGGLSGKKGSLLEGGIREPAIIEWPAMIKSHREIEDVCGTVDIYPTLLDIIGVEVKDQAPLDGQSILPIIEGKEFNRKAGLGFWVYPVGGIKTPSVEWLQGLYDEQQSGKQLPAFQVEGDPSEISGGYSEDEMGGHSAWVDGRYKLHRIPKKPNGFEYKLFDLVEDPAEKTDIAGENPGRVAEMKKTLDQWQRSVIRSLNGEDYSN